MDQTYLMKKLNYIDLFSGCGGLSLGLHQAGWQGLFAIEKSKDAFLTLKCNLIDNKSHFDWPNWLPQSNHEIDKVIETYKSQLKELRGNVDMVAGGPPCQGFSMNGRRNEKDDRNELVESYIEFIKLVMPKVIFFENVKGFTIEFKKNKDKGKQYANYVEKSLKKLGYYVKGMLVDFGDYGIPQRRTRFILVGVHKNVAGGHKRIASRFFSKINFQKQNFLESRGIKINTNLEDAISDLLKENGTVASPDTKGFEAGIYGPPTSNYQLLMRVAADHSVADSHRFAKHQLDTVEKMAFIVNNSRRNKKVDDEIKTKFQIKKHSITLLDKEKKSPTITTLPDDYVHYCEPRILTVREYARIQSFPDWYAIKGKYTTGGKRRIVEVPRYTQIGNAIPPLFAEQSGLIIQELLKQRI